MDGSLKILILEDNKSDADLIQRELKRSGLTFSAEVVQMRDEYILALENFNPDLILSDYSLPSFDAISALQIRQVKHAHVPFIIVSGTIGEENVVNLIKDGVTDYISKDKLFTLYTKINRAIDDTKVRFEKKIQQEELRVAHDLLLQQEETVKAVNLELQELNQELEARVAHRTKALVESETRFRNMMETIPQIAWTNDVSGKVNFYNQRWYDYTGLNTEQTDLLGFNAVIHPDELPGTFNHFYSILKSNVGGEFQVRVKGRDGNFRWHLIRLMPIADQQSLMQLWVGTATDIQELRLLQQQKDDFISIASHELKTPITSLKASLQLLDRIKHKPSSEMFPKLIVQANRSLDKVNSLIEDLLNTSLANEGQLHISQQQVNLSELIEECCNDVRVEGIYTIHTEGDRCAVAYADALRIEQVITNFVNNAIKYAAKSTEIRIRIEKIKDMVKVSVIDQGAGIQPGKLKFLFNRYYRVDHVGSNYTGLGLGLYICSEIIKKHHGEIGVHSEIGKGSIFWFTLPDQQEVFKNIAVMESIE